MADPLDAAALLAAADAARGLDRARLAFCLASGLVVSRVALYAFAEGQTGNAVGATGLVRMARNSRGEAFGDAVVRWRARLARRVGGGA